MLTEIKKAYQIWLNEQEQQPSQEDVENYFSSVQYQHLVDMQHSEASNEELGSFVRELNNHIENEVLGTIELENFRSLFKTIAGQIEPDRTRRLSSLMDAMQQRFRIPLLNNEAYNKANPEVINLFREISYARNL
ncbi:hypothetical protein AAGS61_02130 [Lysinibacillus sp. KU-BSD001]|uniref:hypothetical protein n=1 Tax=Lysinibacillus sp. KU-BSD001 TaxID=3141328 RepID=UPI0036E8CB49